jgi:hypothetical protein
MCAGSWFAFAAWVVLTVSSLANPYSKIPARNVFRLKEPQPPVNFVPPAQPRPAPKLLLTGVADFSTVKWAFITRIDPGRQPANYTLTPGETEGGLQLLDLNANTATVTLRVDGIETVTLQLVAATNHPPKAAPPVRAPVLSRVR